MVVRTFVVVLSFCLFTPITLNNISFNLSHYGVIESHPISNEIDLTGTLLGEGYTLYI